MPKSVPSTILIAAFSLAIAILALWRLASVPDEPPLRSLRAADLHARHIASACRKLAARAAWLSPSNRQQRELSGLPLTSTSAWYILSPVSPRDLEKSPRSDQDGGTWACGLQEESAAARIAERAGRMPRTCVIYSFGSNSDVSFEEQVHAVAPHCDIHTFDPTSHPPPPGSAASAFVHFHGEHGLGGMTEGATAQRGFAIATLRDTMDRLGHASLTLLKFSVAGNEWGVINNIDWATAPAAQVSIELHPAYGVSAVRTIADAAPSIERLEAAGYLLASLEPVTYTNFAWVEVVFLHHDFVPGEPFFQVNEKRERGAS